MLKLVTQRLLYGMLTILVVSVLVFAGTEILPGDVATAILGQNALPETLQAIRDSLGLERPAYIRYFEWLHDLITGDLGNSLANGRKITELILGRLGNTAMLAAFTASIAVPLAVILGIIAAMFPGTVFDRVITVGTLCVISVPEFFIAVLLVLLFAVTLNWLPAIAFVSGHQTFFQTLRTLTLPILTLTFGTMAYMTRMIRTAVLNVVTSPYIELALLKGASRKRIILRHALPNALSPIFNVIALNLAWLVSGVVIVETVFAYPGIAKLMVDAVSTRDLPLVQALGMIFCGTYVVLNILADVLSIIANPRLRHPK
jgi:peptide/nickel transport system permease protein